MPRRTASGSPGRSTAPVLSVSPVSTGGPAPLPADPLLVTADQDLRDQVLRLCAAAAVTPQIIDDAGHARHAWWQSACVLVGEDQAAEVARLDLSRRDGVVLVSTGPESAELWRRGVAVRAEHVVVLPAGQSWLVDRLSDAVDGTGRLGTTVSVVGARGGAGASTFATALGLTAARSGTRSLLVDADPLGGGIDLVVGCEDTSGLRWPEVAATDGRVSAEAFRSALPELDGLAILSWDRGEHQRSTDAATMREMLAAGQRGSRLVVVDLPRRLDEAAAEALLASDLLVLVTTPDVRATAAAVRMLGSLRQLCADIRLVVRSQIRPPGLEPVSISEALGLPLAATIPHTRGLGRSIDDGLGPLGKGRLQRVCAAVLSGLLADESKR